MLCEFEVFIPMHAYLTIVYILIFVIAFQDYVPVFISCGWFLLVMDQLGRVSMFGD